MRFFLLASVLSVGFATGPAFGQGDWTLKSGNDVLTIAGVGDASCGTWTARRAQGRPHAWGYEQWLMGFLTGASVYGKPGLNPMGGVDHDGVWAWVDNYCRAYPLNYLSRAGSAFVQAHPH
jgi:hypothetical protein